MARVTAAEVQAILEDNEFTDSVVESFIAGATEMVTDAFKNDTTTTAALKKEIERWFTAHMIASTLLRMPQKAKAGPASIEYVGTSGKDLQQTPYGQVVKTLDTSGKMASLGNKKVNVYAVTSFDS